MKEVLDANGVRVLVDMLPLAHLHTTRATVPLQTNVIEASADMKRESEKEWYYGNKDKERLGPFGFDEVRRWLYLGLYFFLKYSSSMIMIIYEVGFLLSSLLHYFVIDCYLEIKSVSLNFLSCLH